MDVTTVEKFLRLSEQAKIEALVRLAWELAVVGRDAYEPGTNRLTHPTRLRAINEIQHRISAHVLAMLRGDERRYPDVVLARMILEEDNDPVLQDEIARAFAQVIDGEASRQNTVAHAGSRS